MKLLITCEHASNKIPPKYLSLFNKNRAILNTHRAWDKGALELAQYFSQSLNAPCMAGQVSRLLIDLNRSLGHPELLSRYSRHAGSPKELEKIYHKPYRQKVERFLSSWIAKNHPVLHLSVHSFTPVFRQTRRQVDIGLLYDPKRKGEREFCALWKKKIISQNPKLKVCMNQPYKGTSDSLTTSLRQRFSENHYFGIELEINQKFVRYQPKTWKSLQHLLINSLKNT